MNSARKPPGHDASYEERLQWGRSRREAVPRVAQAGFTPGRTREDPVALLVRANAGRVPELLPIKWGRMAASPFGFFRGAAPVMAADLGSLRRTRILVQLCGDAHVRNLGAFAAPDGHLVFDVNDFDETIPGPFEWDLKRLATSFVLAGREAGDVDALCGEAVLVLVRSYREALTRFARLPVLELFRHEVRRFSGVGPVHAILRKAERATAAQVLRRLTVTRGSSRRIAHRPPVLRTVPPPVVRRVLAALRSYRDTVSDDRQLVLDSYRPLDVGFKVVGTGSVGLRDYIVLCCGSSPEDPLFLQVKEEAPSCWAEVLPAVRKPSHEGRRVAEAQHRMQTVSDPFLGWTTIARRPYLVRQLADHKAGIEADELKGDALLEYAAVSGEVFAKAHARTGDAAALVGYCGRSDRLDRALRKFAFAYAAQTEKDHAALVVAIKKGRLKARSRV